MEQNQNSSSPTNKKKAQDNQSDPDDTVQPIVISPDVTHIGVPNPNVTEDSSQNFIESDNQTDPDDTVEPIVISPDVTQIGTPTLNVPKIGKEDSPNFMNPDVEETDQGDSDEENPDVTMLDQSTDVTMLDQGGSQNQAEESADVTMLDQGDSQNQAEESTDVTMLDQGDSQNQAEESTDVTMLDQGHAQNVDTPKAEDVTCVETGMINKVQSPKVQSPTTGNNIVPESQAKPNQKPIDSTIRRTGQSGRTHTMAPANERSATKPPALKDNSLASTIHHPSQRTSTKSSRFHTQSNGEDFQPGDIINNKYKVLQQLGAGGMGTVLKVEHLLLSQKKFFAMKVLNASVSQRPDIKKRFVREVEIAMEFHHPHAVPLRDYGEMENGCQYFTMDLCTGTLLKDLIAKEGRLSEKRALEITRQTLSVLNEAHSKTIIHRDLKPANIFIEDNNGKDHAMVLDFGIAKILAPGEEQLTQSCAVIGTPQYMSPEQSLGEPLDGRSDLYSLGVILYEMVTGKRPFTGEIITEIIAARMLKPVIPPREVCPEVSKETENIILKALKKQKEERFATAEEFTTAIDEILNPALKSKSTKGLISLRKVLIASGLALFIVAIFSVFSYMQYRFSHFKQEFTRVMGQKKFTEAEKIWKEIPHRSFYSKNLDQLKADLVKEKKEYVQESLNQAEACMDKKQWAEALALLQRAESVESGIATREMGHILKLMAGLQAMKREDWSSAYHAFQSIDTISKSNFLKREFSTFFQEYREICQKELNFLSLQKNGKEKLEQANWNEAKAIFGKAEQIKKDSAAKYLMAVEQILKAEQIMQNKEWENSLKNWENAREYCENEIACYIPLLNHRIEECKREIQRQVQREEARQKRVQKLLAQVKQSLDKKDWQAMGKLLENLQKEKLLDAEKRELSPYHAIYPPVRLEIFSQNPGQAWSKATILQSGCRYRFKVDITSDIYIYGFQRDSLNKIYDIFPQYPAVDSKTKKNKMFTLFENPVKPGEIYIPSPTASFALDANKGKETFYILYGNQLVKNPRQILEDHIAKKKVYSLITEISLEHQ